MESELLNKLVTLQLGLDGNTRRIDFPVHLTYLFPKLIDSLIYFCDTEEDKGVVTEVAFDVVKVDGEIIDMMIEYATLFHNKASVEDFGEFLKEDYGKTMKMGLDSFHSVLLSIHVGIMLSDNAFAPSRVALVFNKPLWSPLVRFFHKWDLGKLFSKK